jgi:hypothetical protein
MALMISKANMACYIAGTRLDSQIYHMNTSSMYVINISMLSNFQTDMKSEIQQNYKSGLYTLSHMEVKLNIVQHKEAR